MLKVDVLIMELASVQHGIVSRRQLLRAGASAGGMARRINAGLLEPMHAGVYRVRGVKGRLGYEMAAVLACGGAGVAMSHAWAAGVLSLLPQPAPPLPVSVLVEGRAPVRRGVQVHRVPALLPEDVALVDGVPVTTIARVLLDLARVQGAAEVERLAARALREDLVTDRELEAAIRRHPQHRGARLLQSVVTGEAPPVFTRSKAEQRLLELLRRSGLPLPAMNVRVHGYEVDCYWRAQRLVVEVDGRQYHSSRQAFEMDRRRDRTLAVAGLLVLRVTWQDLHRRPEQLLVEITRALHRAA
jgi:very-short-patch-repair endonuclease